MVVSEVVIVVEAGFVVIRLIAVFVGTVALMAG